MTRYKGYVTKSRTDILDYLISHQDQAVTIQEIYETLQKQESTMNLTTIYRYLNQLNKDGLVIKYVAKKGEKATFQYVGEHQACQNHLHMQCRNCGRMIHLDCSFMKEIQDHIYEHHGFSLECNHSILFGLCDLCTKH